MINVLLKNGFAFKFADNFVVSCIKFVIDLDTVYTNPKIKRFYKTLEVDVPYKANIFDLDLCSAFFMDPMLNFIKYSDVMALTLPRKGDLKKYKLRKKLKKVTEKYLDRCYESYMDSEDEIEEYFDNVESDINELISVERIMGTEDMLVDEFKECLNDFGLSDEDGFKIIENINNALENDELTIKGCPTRMQYLVKNIDRIDGEAVDDEGCCPFCGEPINEVYKSCENCGQKLRDISVMEKFSQDLGNFDINDFLDDFDHDKFSELLESDEFWGRVPIEENDPYFDLKTFYNETLTSFDFEEVKEFYDKSDKSMPIDKIFEDFFDDL